MSSNEEDKTDTEDIDNESDTGEVDEIDDEIDVSTLLGYQFEPEKHVSSSSDDDDSTSDGEYSSDEESFGDARIGNTVWCTCGYCKEMDTYEESLCCKEDVPGDLMGELKCITYHDDFETVCLNNAVLRTTLSMLNNLRGDNITLDNNSFRYAAYRQFTWWIHNRLGKGVRRVIPFQYGQYGIDIPTKTQLTYHFERLQRRKTDCFDEQYHFVSSCVRIYIKTNDMLF